MPDRSTRTEPDILPAITLDVEPTPAGLAQLAAELTAFGRDHELPEAVAARLTSVASEVADLLTGAVDAPPLARLQADADIGRDDAQLVVIAGDQRLIEAYKGLRPRLEHVAARCDAFAAQLGRNADVQVWARFELDHRLH